MFFFMISLGCFLQNHPNKIIKKNILFFKINPVFSVHNENLERNTVTVIRNLPFHVNFDNQIFINFCYHVISDNQILILMTN